jgi:hypothetical protein
MTVCDALLVPAVCDANVSVVGETAAVALAVTPVPLRPTGGTACNEFVENINEPEYVVAAVGVNVTLYVTDAPGAMLVVLGATSVNCEGVIEIPERVSVAVPVFRNVTVWSALVVPTVCEPNESAVGVVEPKGATPVPLSFTAGTDVVELVLNVSVPE